MPQQSPLSINVLSSLFQDTGLNINPISTQYLGTSKTNTDYTPGSLVDNTCLKQLTYAINDAYTRGQVDQTPAGSSVYDNLITIGQNSIPALGNSKSSGYTITDPSNNWSNYPSSATYKGPATTGYSIAGNVGQGQEATWIPWSTLNDNVAVTQWGFLRSFALQAWNEYNFNGIPAGSGMPEYKSFVNSFLNCKSFLETTNQTILSLNNSINFLQGTFSNSNDLSTGDISGVTLATQVFGQDCISLGKIINLSKIDKFGLPSALLQTLYSNNALTQALTLALLSSGLTIQEITTIANGTASNITMNQEQKIYGSFLVITGVNLSEILIPLNCKTKNLESLADLLNVKKIFPNSYQSLTVPVYDMVNGRSNSKIYYLLYENDSVSTKISSYLKDTSVVPNLITSNTNSFNFQPQDQGFGSYLYQILPDDLAVAAGAFSASMLQIKNILSVDFQKFSQVIFSIEMPDRNMNLVSGTTEPTNTSLANTTLTKLALGSGPHGTYTMSDFFGCMSGLPYMWNDLQKYIKNLTSKKLQNIYNELYLATTWESATVTVQYSTGPGPTFIKTITGITITDPGGGYGRGSAVAPTITISGGSGATAVCTIGTDSSDVGSNGNGTYGRVISATITSIGTPNGTIPTVTIQSPPVATLPVDVNGNVSTAGTNTASGYAGWPGMNTVVDDYITQANTEISAIQVSNSNASNVCNKIYYIAGQQLTVEQRARFTALPPVAIPRDTSEAVYPTTITNFVNSISEYSKNTMPHMHAQTLESISDLSTVGGQNLLSLMRQERNAARLQEIGITLDNKIPDTLDDKTVKLLTSNGTVPTGLFGIDISGVNGNITNPNTTYTLPSNYLQQGDSGQTLSTCPMGFYDPNTETYKVSNQVSQVGQYTVIEQILSLPKNSTNNTNLLGPNLDGTGPANQLPVPITNQIDTGINIFQTGVEDLGINAAPESVALEPIAVVRAGPRLVSGVGSDLVTSSPMIPGSFAGSEISDVIPPNLNAAYTSSTLGCFKYDVDEAIAEVIKCNCDI